MKDKVLIFEKTPSRYIRIAKEKVKKGEYTVAISLLFSALKLDDRNLEAIFEIAKIYSIIGKTKLSNNFLFYYLSIASAEESDKAYTELVSNFYYKDFNLLMASYYFNLLIKDDEPIDIDEVDERIRGILQSVPTKKRDYYVAYDKSKPSYDEQLLKAKMSFYNGNYSRSIECFDEVPSEHMTAETFYQKAICCIVNKNDEKAHETCSEALKKVGEHFLVYSAFFSYYCAQNNLEKMQYYYDKALSYCSFSEADSYKMVNYAIEMEDHKTVIKSIERILQKNPYEHELSFFYGLALLNEGNYQKAEEVFTGIYKLCPTEMLYEYYKDLVIKLQSGESLPFKKLFPLPYDMNYPIGQQKLYKKRIKELELLKSKNVLKNSLTRQAVKWGLNCDEKEIIERCLAVAIISKDLELIRYIKKFLLDVDYPISKKVIIVYSLVANRTRISFSLTTNGFFGKFKYKRLPFDEDENSRNFVLAYAEAISRAIVFSDKEFRKIYNVVSALHKKYLSLFNKECLLPEEISALIYYRCGFEEVKSIKEICRVFGINEKRFKQIKQLIEGETDG